MWMVPIFLGAAVSRFTWTHALLGVAALAFHVGSSATLEGVRLAAAGRLVAGARVPGRQRAPDDIAGGRARWYLARGGLCLGAGVVLMALPVLRWPLMAAFGGLGLSLLFIQAMLTRARRERTLAGDALGVAGLELWGPMAYLVGGGTPDRTMGLLWALCTAFFLGTAFHVKSLFRERGNPGYKRLSYAAHAVLLLVAPALGFPEATVAYVPSALRAWLTPAGARVKPLTAGVIEIVNSVAFAALLLYTWRGHLPT